MKLTMLFIISIIVPVLIIIWAMPSYFHSLISEDTTALTEGTLTTLSGNLETYLEDLERLTVAPYWSAEVMQALKVKASETSETELYTKYLTEKSLTGTLPIFLKNTRKDILGTILLPFDGSAYVTSLTNANEATENFPFTKQDWYKKALEADGRVSFISVHPQDYLKYRTTTQVFSVARLIKDPDSSQPLAVIMADADTVVLERIVRDIRFNVSSIIAIYDDNEKLIYSTHPLSKELEEKAILEGPNGQTVDSYVVVSKQISTAKWTVVVLLSNTELKEKVRWMYAAGALFAGGGIVLTLLVFFVLSSAIIKPFKEMILVMRRVQRGDLKTRFSFRGRDEISELGAAFNTMIDQLGDLIDSEYKAVLSKRNAEYRALQSQIQPHFLYNTLNGFIGLNRMGDRKLLEKAIFSLSSMLRYILEHNDWTTLGEELQFLRQYGELQQIRFSDKLTVYIQSDSDVHGIRLPKLLLQPLVENAIIHGIEPMDRHCLLRIESHWLRASDREMLEIVIADNGMGFLQDKVNEKVDIGMANVRERLHLAYEHAELSIYSKPLEGTTITIHIPVQGGTL
jgi:two-component system sensor histidine kinase YesM